MKLKGKLIISFLAVAAIVLAAGAIGIYSGDRIYTESNEVISGQMPIKDASMEAIIALQNSIDKASEYILQSKNITDSESTIRENLRLFKLWIDAMMHGTESREFSNSSSGELYRQEGFDVVLPHGGSEEVVRAAERAESSHGELKPLLNELFETHGRRITYNFEYEGRQWNIVDFLHLVELQHVRWIEDLQKSATADSLFTGETDHTLCFFGRWLYNYHIEDPDLNELLETLEPMHHDLHNAAISINETSGREAKLEVYRGDLTPTAESIKEIFTSLHAYVDPLMRHLQNREGILLEEIQNEASKAQSSLEELESIIDTEVELAVEEVVQQRNSSVYLLVAASLIGVLLALLIGLFMAARIGTPIRKISEQARSIADGDFSIDRLNIESSDETGLLAEAFSQMSESIRSKVTTIGRIADGDLSSTVEMSSERDELGATLAKMRDSLQSLVSQVKIAIGEVNSGAEQISQGSQSLSQSATEQASSVQEISSSVNQLNGQAKQNAQGAEEATKLAVEAKETASGGNSYMQKLLAVMEGITDSTEEIRKVVKVIDDISFQINLLALNANVEAARAGKYGKGFAVVADEVRSLAVKSAESVKETNQIVENTVQKIIDGNSSAQQTANMLEEIVEQSGKVADFLGEISNSSNEQAQALDQISGSLDQIDQTTQSNTAAAEQSASAAEELTSQAEQLKGIIEKFVLAEEVEERIGYRDPAPRMIEGYSEDGSS
ncbi:MAG TPA: HAMP domain-containing protein [Sediminispirochaeta sp.]|nr:HAMP domain-containing protein [Sediminispirochaeta sp.]